MDEDQDRMYVGCRDHVLSMNINNITHRVLKVRASPHGDVFWPASASKIEECQMAGKDPTVRGREARHGVMSLSADFGQRTN
ncbi:hypothetical protein JZ751_016214 [Albula glossodonta]|uniref:Sema domain-containing protein n=1 Tax=Albula glossodonta TaxID=121402 RepID=A0A8T2N692_9TELE|nr:hypothetical protein JZ751_016214 [Albula glossodonta]